MPDLSESNFPQLTAGVRARWAPVFLSPIMGSPERLVIAIAAISAHASHVESANALSRLRCLYGGRAETALFASEIAIQELRADLGQRGADALLAPRPIFSGVSLGDMRDGEGPDLATIARAWMSAISSLYDAAKIAAEIVAYQEAGVSEEAAVPGMGDRLAALVMDYVTRSRPGLQDFFDDEIRERRPRRRKSKVHSVNIDFAGSRVVANFGTFMAAHRATSVDRIKRRMFDLLVDRDRERGTFNGRAHEMLVHHPSHDDPQVSERQLEDIHEALDDLSNQARAESLEFFRMTSVADIGNHLVEREARVIG